MLKRYASSKFRSELVTLCRRHIKRWFLKYICLSSKNRISSRYRCCFEANTNYTLDATDDIDLTLPLQAVIKRVTTATLIFIHKAVVIQKP